MLSPKRGGPSGRREAENPSPQKPDRGRKTPAVAAAAAEAPATALDLTVWVASS
jgi:hypothetical protein